MTASPAIRSPVLWLSVLSLGKIGPSGLSSEKERSMDSLLKDRVSTLRSSRLPKSLHGYVSLTGRCRGDFPSVKEWQQHAKIYRVMAALNGGEGFTILAIRILEYIDRHPAQQHTTPAAQQKKVRRKESRNRKKRSALTSAQKDSALASRLRDSKPTASESLETWHASTKIGLGIKSILPPAQRVRRDQIKLDDRTAPRTLPGSSRALYVAGWSLKQDVD